jgi:hypothetical protein
MFLNIPIIEYNEETDEYDGKEETIDINPMCISVIERSHGSRKCCVITMVNDDAYLVRLTRAQLKDKISEWMKDNLLSKIYKDIKDQTN